MPLSRRPRVEPRPAAARLFSAFRLLLGPEDWVEDGGLLVHGGRVARVLRSAAAVRRAARSAEVAREHLEGLVLVPGLVDAHAHLELTGLRGALSRQGPFVDWLRGVVAARRGLAPREVEADVLAGARRLLETGTTTVGDIDSSGAMARTAGRTGMRVRLYREVLDAWDPTRTARALAALRRALPPRRLRTEGVSPHAPYTTSDALLCGVRVVSQRRRLPLMVHWAETPEEIDWCERGAGPLAELLARPPLRSGLELLRAAGLLGPRTALVHGNHPSRGEPGRIARRGTTLVHCPGTHAFFAREPFPWRRYARAGVPLALGTDSLASNEDLDMRREMRLARESAPWIAPRRIFAMATSTAAQAVDLEGAGSLRPKALADFAAHRFEAATCEGVLEELTSGGGEVRGVWVGGRRVAGGACAGPFPGPGWLSPSGRGPTLVD